MRSTEINKGTFRGNIETNGQWDNRQEYCPTCHAHNGRPHSIGCKDEFVFISPTARIPRKNASKQQWKYFNKKFVKKEKL